MSKYYTMVNTARDIADNFCDIADNRMLAKYNDTGFGKMPEYHKSNGFTDDPGKWFFDAMRLCDNKASELMWAMGVDFATETINVLKNRHIVDVLAEIRRNMDKIANNHKGE